MGGPQVRNGEGCRLLSTPPLVPNAALMLGFLLGSLLQAVMAGLAEGLKVVFIPEQPLITTMGLDVVAHEP